MKLSSSKALMYFEIILYDYTANWPVTFVEKGHNDEFNPLKKIS